MATAEKLARRHVHYDSLAELLDDARRINSSDTTTVGEWSQGQIFQHLGVTVDSSVNGFGFSAPWPMRFMLITFMKKKFLTKPLPAGFKVPAKLRKAIPADATTTDEGLKLLEDAIQQFDAADSFAPHPFLNQLTRDEWIAFHLRHAELNMSFIV